MEALCQKTTGTDGDGRRTITIGSFCDDHSVRIDQLVRSQKD